MAESHFLTPGVAFPFYVKGRPGRYPELRGTYEPLGAEGTLEWMNRHSRIPVDQQNDNEFNTVAAQLRSWSAGKQISPDTVRQMPGDLYIRLRDIICYEIESDVDPTLTKQAGSV